MPRKPKPPAGAPPTDAVDSAPPPAAEAPAPELIAPAPSAPETPAPGVIDPAPAAEAPSETPPPAEASQDGTPGPGATRPKRARKPKEPAPVEGAAADGTPAAKAPRKKTSKGVDPAALSIAELVEHVLADPRVVYFPVKHFSPACAHHVARLIREIKPVGVLVEGPDDATALIPFIVHEDTHPPFTIFSSYVDKDNQFGQNGIQSPSPTMPARFRGWWPMTDYAPEYAALRAGKEVGAKLAFIDAPLVATIPHHHVPLGEAAQKVDDRHLAESAYFEALRQRQRRRSFEEFWNANFEVSCQALSTAAFMRRVLTFAHCARLSGADHLAALEADGTLLREACMRQHLDAFLKENPEGKVVVVTGAFHSVALPFTKGEKIKARVDKNLETLLTGHSFQALATLYDLARLPGYGQVVWEHLENGSPEPWNAAAIQLLIQIMRGARDAKEGVSTADSVGAYHVARNLAVLRRNEQATLEDVLDAVRMAYVKGDSRVRGGEVDRVAREVLVGARLGRVTSDAGQAPLVRDFYQACKAHKLDITGTSKVVRCDLGKQEEHRYKSAFLHQCDALQVPMFAQLDDTSWNAKVRHFKGPNLATGEDMHLITETWGVKWQVTVDDRLLEISDRGASIAQAATSLARERLLKAQGNAAETSQLLLESVQMMLLDVFEELLSAVEDAIVVDASFHNLVKALGDFVLLSAYRDAVSPEHAARVARTVTTLFGKSCLVMPMLANTQPDGVREAQEDLQTLVRVTLTFEAVALDRGLLGEKIAELVADIDGAPALRGAGFGVLFSFGATSERAVARELDGYLLGSSERVLQAGAFLDGLFASSKSVFLGSPRLLHAIGRVLRQLDWATFKILLPDLRRAFTQFIPTEIDDISTKVSEDVGLASAPARDAPIPDALARVGAAADEKVRRVLEAWGG